MRKNHDLRHFRHRFYCIGRFGSYYCASNFYRPRTQNEDGLRKRSATASWYSRPFACFRTRAISLKIAGGFKLLFFWVQNFFEGSPCPANCQSRGSFMFPNHEKRRFRCGTLEPFACSWSARIALISLFPQSTSSERCFLLVNLLYPTTLSSRKSRSKKVSWLIVCKKIEPVAAGGSIFEWSGADSIRGEGIEVASERSCPSVNPRYRHSVVLCGDRSALWFSWYLDFFDLVFREDRVVGYNKFTNKKHRSDDVLWGK